MMLYDTFGRFPFLTKGMLCTPNAPTQYAICCICSPHLILVYR